MAKKKQPPSMAGQAAKAETLLKALANAQRLRLLCALAERAHTVGELVTISELSQSAVSQHLSKMRELGLVSKQRVGQHMHYRLCSMEAQAILSVLYLIYCNKN